MNGDYIKVLGATYPDAQIKLQDINTGKTYDIHRTVHKNEKTITFTFSSETDEERAKYYEEGTDADWGLPTGGDND